MTGRDAQREGRMRHAAAIALLTVAVFGTGVARAQTVNPAAGTVTPGGTVSTNVTGIACPWALVPAQVSYVRTPVACSGGVTAYTLEFAVAATGEPGDHPVEIFDCGAPPCTPSGQTFTLSIQAAVATPTPTPPPEEDDETPTVTTPREEFLDARLALLKRELADDAQAVFDGVDDLREGEEHTLTLELDVPGELVEQLRGNQLFEGGQLYVAHVVRAQLAGEGFEIRSSSDLSQGARNGTWAWRVRPIGSGSRELALTMTMNGEGVDRTREVFVARPYDVAASWSFKIKRFFAASWQWLIGTAITLVLAYLGMRKKKQQPPPPEKPAAPSPQTT